MTREGKYVKLIGEKRGERVKYDIESSKLTMSVRELVGMALPHGDIDNRTAGSSERAVLGTKIHKKIQREAGASYTAEVALIHTFLYDGICYEVSGRADGIITDTDGTITVDEIKSVRSAYFVDSSPIHFAQLKCYAFFVCDTRALEKIKVRLTYYNIETKEIKYFVQEYTYAKLKIFYSNMLSQVSRFARLEREKMLDRIPSISDSGFPYENIRQGQRELISEGFRAIKHKRRLFAQAPTGIGKTISSLYPAVKAFGEGMCDKIFYLTAKTSTGEAAREASKTMCEQGAKLKYISLSSRESVCLCPGGAAGGKCNPFECEYAKGYYTRAYDAIYELLTSGNGFDRKQIKEAAKKYRICPHELSLDLSLWCDIVICDYNYLFDPRVYLRRYFDQIRERYVFLVDEAHNLADRAREMYSASISAATFIKLYSMLPKQDKILLDITEESARSIMGLKRLFSDGISTDENGGEAGFYISREPLLALGEKLKKFTERCERWFYVYRDLDERFAPLKEQITELYFSVRQYLGILDFYDKRFITYLELKNGDITCRLFCLDPSHVLDVCMNRGIASILFSATLTPVEYFKDILGGGKRALTLTLPSPFERENLCLAAVDTVSTRYADRDTNTKEIAELIAAAICGKKGNYIAYFPSYKYMNTVYSAFTSLYPRVKTAIQKSERERISAPEFLSHFKAQKEDFFVGFCVLGGSFSEGIDLPGERLIGTVVVGVGLPQLSSELNIIRDHYQEVYESGYEYAYVYPGMNKILQATGRVIRREEDRGVVVLIDDRYATREYTRLFPEHWSELKYAGNARSLAALVKKFWQKHEKNEQKQ